LGNPIQASGSNAASAASAATAPSSAGGTGSPFSSLPTLDPAAGELGNAQLQGNSSVPPASPPQSAVPGWRDNLQQGANPTPSQNAPLPFLNSPPPSPASVSNPTQVGGVQMSDPGPVSPPGQPTPPIMFDPGPVTPPTPVMASPQPSPFATAAPQMPTPPQSQPANPAATFDPAMFGGNGPNGVPLYTGASTAPAPQNNLLSLLSQGGSA